MNSPSQSHPSGAQDPTRAATTSEPSAADWQVAAEQITGNLIGTAAVLARKAGDELYASLMEATQDYLRDNVAYNLNSHIAMLERERKFAQAERDAERAAKAALVEALRAALPQLEAWADDASNDIGACIQEGGRPTEDELARMRLAGGVATNARAAIAKATGGQP